MAATSELPADQADVVAFLQSGEGFGGSRPRRIDTHVAAVFLTEDRAWKLKRAVRFNYLDFSTPDLRRAALEAELRLNRRTAHSLYIAVHPLTREPGGRLAIDGSGESIDWLLEMRRFDDGALMADLAEHGLDDGSLLRLADRIAAFHDTAEIAEPSGGAAFRGIVEIIDRSLENAAPTLGQEHVDNLRFGLKSALTAQAGLLDERARAGRVRRGHGDLHLANIARIDGELVPFDCIEFSETLATVDVLYDLAFLLMDLWHRGCRTQANILFNRYLDVSVVDEGGLALMPLFMSARAAIRAHVLAAQGTIAEARSYLYLARRLLRPTSRRLIAIGGLSGTGKSTLARAIAGEIGRAPGARILRSDVLRKHIAGVRPETKLDARWYAAKVSHDVYDMLAQRAAMTLAAGQSAISDAVFADARERRAIATVAELAGIPFAGLFLKASSAVRDERVTARGPDASDADTRVVNAQTQYHVGQLDAWRAIDTTHTLSETVQRARQALGLVALDLEES